MLYPTPTRARARAGQEAYSARHWQAAAQANPGVGEEELARMLACQWARAGEAERAGAEVEAAADRERCDGAGRVRRGCLGGTGRARLGPGALCGARGRGCGGHVQMHELLDALGPAGGAPPPGPLRRLCLRAQHSAEPERRVVFPKKSLYVHVGLGMPRLLASAASPRWS